MKAEAQKEHQWLQKLVGEWTYESEMPNEQGTPVKYTGTEVVRPLGDLWIVGESKGLVPGGEHTNLITLGYDPLKKRYVGTFIASVMTHLWVYEGELDASGRELALNCEGPSMAGDGSMAPYKDVIAFESDDHRTLTGHMQGKDGTWQVLMTVSYRRKR